MNVGFKFEFPWGDEYYAYDTVEIGGIQYEGTVSSSTPLELTMSEDGQYETASITITYQDVSGSFKARLADADADSVYGSVVTMVDTSGATLATKYLEKYSYSQNEVTHVISDYYSELNNIITANPITIDEFPKADINAFSLNINYFSGHFMHNGSASQHKNLIKAPYVNKTATYKYLVGIPMSGATPTNLRNAFRPDTMVDITGLCTLHYDATNNYAYIEYTDSVQEYIVVNIQYSEIIMTIKDIIDEVSSQFFVDYTLDASSVDSLLNDRHYLCDDVDPGWGLYHRYAHYLIDSEMTGNKILEDICNSCGLNFNIDGSGNIVFYKPDFSSLAADQSIESGKINSFGYDEVDTNELHNKIIINYAYNYVDGVYDKIATHNKQESYDRYGIHRTKTINDKMSPNVYVSPGDYSFSHFTAKYDAIENKNPPLIATITMNIDDIINRVPTEYIEFSHLDAIDETTRLYLIKKILFDHIGDSATLTLRDITEYKSLRINDRFLFQPNSDILDSFIYRDSAISGNAYMLSIAGAGNGVKHKQAVKKYMASSAYFDGVAVLASDSEWPGVTDAFDILNQTSFTLEFWVRHDSASGTIETYMCNRDDATNYWRAGKSAADKFEFSAAQTAGGAITLTSTTTIVADTFYHIAIVNAAGEGGLYVDGVQEDFDNSNWFVDTFNVAFVLGYFTSGTYEMVGYIALARITHDNFFSAAPVVGLTDTITVPWDYLKDDGTYNSDFVLLEHGGFLLQENGGKLII